MSADLKLATRVFAHQEADLELWQEINKILGFDNLEECHEWPVRNSKADFYDYSIEVFLNDFKLTREHADKILDLGFEFVYETCSGATTAWNHQESWESSPCEDEGDKRLITKYRNEIRRLKEENQRLGAADCGCQTGYP